MPKKIEPEREIEILRLHFEGKHTFAEVARTMRVTKGVVAGVVNRARLAGKTVKWEGVRVPTKRPRKKPAPNPVKHSPLPKSRFKADPETEIHRYRDRVSTVGKSLRENIPLEALTEPQCRFPVTDDKPFLFCGKARSAGKPYCPDHCVTAYDPIDIKPKKRPKHPQDINRLSTVLSTR